MTPPSSPDYAGDISAQEAWELLGANPEAQLVDVRTMAANPMFVGEAQAAVKAAGADENTPILFLCRSGARSRAAAMALASMGFSKALNVAGGFEGDPDGMRHRGNINGWKAAGLPWRQG